MKMNLDATDEAMAPNEFREVYHCHEDGSTGRLVNMRGFENVMNRPVNAGFTMPGQMKCVGTTRDVESSTIIYFLMDTSGTAHSIMQMQVETKALTWILRDEPLLNFKKRLEADVVEGLLYWTDGYFGSFLNNDFNPPRKVNIAKAVKYTTAKASSDCWRFEKIRPVAIDEDTTGTTYLSTTTAAPYAAGDYIVPFALDGINRNKNVTGHCQVLEVFQSGGYYGVVTTRPWQESDSSYHDVTGHVLPYEPDMYFGIDWQVMDRVKYPPTYAPTASYESDSSINSNNLRNGLFQFAYRWVFDDNEKSVFSPKSEIPLPSVMGMLDGSYSLDQTIDNDIVVWADSGPIEATAVEIAVRTGNTGAWFIVKKINKYNEDGDCIFPPDIYLRYDFYNTDVGENIINADVERPFDAVPLISEHQDIIEKNRIVDANYIEGFDGIDIDVSLSSHQTTPQIGSIGGILTEHQSGRVITMPYSPGITPPNPFFHSCEIDFTDFWEPGYIYTVSIDAYPAVYNNPEGLEWPDPDTIYQNFAYKRMAADAVVNSPIGSTFEEFSNSLVAQLRNGNNGNSAVIALNEFDYKGFNQFPSFVTYIPINNPPLAYPPSNTVGVVIEYTTETPPVSVNSQYFNVRVIKASNLSTTTTFKSGATHPFGIFYFDRANRHGAVNRNEQSKIFIQEQNNIGDPHELYKNEISWSINHVPPVWATHYTWAYPKNTSTSFSLFATISNIDIINATNSLFICVNQLIVDTAESVKKFNIPAYTWEPGDRIRIVASRSGNTFLTIPNSLDYEIIGTLDPADDGSGDTYQKNDLGDLIKDANGNAIKDYRQTGILVQYFNYRAYGVSEDDTIVEIYRPKKVSDPVVYYQFGEVLPISNPHTASRSHGAGFNGTTQYVINELSIVPATGTFKSGDAYLRYRSMGNVFPCESFSYSDYFDSSAISIGNINKTSLNEKQFKYISKLIYSGRLIQNTRINELSRVDSSDSFELPDKYGPIYKIEEVGDELKIIQKNHTSKILIGRAGVTQPNEEGTQIMSSTKDVLGTLLQTRWDFGTVHPGSFVKNGHKAYWFDFYAHAICRDPGNGIQNLTDLYGMKQFFIDRCRLFGSADNVDVVGGFDQQNEFLWWTFTDLTAPDNSFTIAFKDTGGRNEDGFVMLAQFLPDDYGESKMTMTAFKDNALWLMNSDDAPRCNFFGTQYKYWFTPVFNTQPITVKRWLQIMLSSPKRLSAPNAGDVSVGESGNSPNGMVSLLKSGAFTPIQGKYVADFGKNMTTTSLTPTLRDLVNGEDMEGKAIRVRLEGEETEEHKVLAVEVEGVTTGV